MTFSIVAYDPDEQAWGAAVASKFLAAGAVVIWAEANAGAVATQSYAKMPFGPDGLALMRSGLSAPETLAKLLATDEDAESRQVGMIDASGEVVAHTGSDCFAYADHILGERFSVQGNILAGKPVLDAMASAFRTSAGRGLELADRLVAALAAGDQAGGDRRGKQAAAVLVVKADGGYGGDNDRYLDLRVDDHPEPVARLAELVTLHHLYFQKAAPETCLTITPELSLELQQIIARAGRSFALPAFDPRPAWDETAHAAFWEVIGIENLEERWSPDDHPELIDPLVLDFLRARYPG